MFSSFNKAYGAGYRAGRSEPEQVFVTKPDGREVSFLVIPTNPYRPWAQYFLHFLWQEGHYNGTVARLNVRMPAHG